MTTHSNKNFLEQSTQALTTNVCAKLSRVYCAESEVIETANAAHVYQLLFKTPRGIAVSIVIEIGSTTWFPCNTLHLCSCRLSS